MDDDSLESDLETPDIISTIHLPPTFGSEIDVINFIYQSFYDKYDDSPVFFPGTLRDACQAAFNPVEIHERRPLLIFIHNDENLLSKNFSRTILCSANMNEYLPNNYIVCLWNISFQSSRNILTKIWKELFSSDFLNDFSIEECPLLIGVTRIYQYKNNELPTAEYKLTTLLKRDTLIRDQTKVNRDELLNELHRFKMECDENENILSFDFIKTTGLCWEIILEIVKYLSLNDAISTFSPRILSLLTTSQSKFQLSNVFVPFFRMILRCIQSDRIIALQLDGNRLYSSIELDYLFIFKKIIFLTLLNLSYEKKINEYLDNFPNLTYLSLCYDYEIDFNMFHGTFNQLSNRIQRLEIHSAGIFNPHFKMNGFDGSYLIDNSVKYFLFDIGHFLVSSIDNDFTYHQRCFATILFDFIPKMQYIKCVHLIINENTIEQLLNLNVWENLINECLKLERIIFEVVGNVSQIDELTRNVLEIQTALRQIRQSIKVQFKFS